MLGFAIEMLNHSFFNALSKSQRKAPQIIFVGNNISSTYIQDVIDFIKEKDFSINVISKSGTTTEPAIAFRIFRKLLEDKYGREEAKNVFMLRQIKRAEPSKHSQMKKDMNHLLSRMMSADDILF